jgi:hypothetical protein
MIKVKWMKHSQRVKIRKTILRSHTEATGTREPLYHYYILGFADYANRQFSKFSHKKFDTLYATTIIKKLIQSQE